MDSTITSIRSRGPDRGTAPEGGFTLVEILVSATLSGFLLLGVLTSFLFIARSGANLSNYVEMDTEARSSLEQFAQDTRMASDLIWNSTTSITVTRPTSGGSESYTYNYDSSLKEFSRQLTSPTTGTKEVLMSGVTTFTLTGYKINADTVDISTTNARLNAGKVTKQIQLSLEASRTSNTVATATNTVLSARFILRNKTVTT